MCCSGLRLDQSDGYGVGVSRSSNSGSSRATCESEMNDGSQIGSCWVGLLSSSVCSDPSQGFPNSSDSLPIHPNQTSTFLRSKKCPMGAGESHTHFCALVSPSIKWEEGSPNMILLERRQTQMDATKKRNKEVKFQVLERFW